MHLIETILEAKRTLEGVGEVSNDLILCSANDCHTDVLMS